MGSYSEDVSAKGWESAPIYMSYLEDYKGMSFSGSGIVAYDPSSKINARALRHGIGCPLVLMLRGA